MKVLWFTNIPLPDMISSNTSAHAGTGGWMIALLESLRQQSDIRLAVACVYHGLESRKLESNGVSYFCIPQGRRKRLFHFADAEADSVYINKCARVVQEWQPNVIHIHGTERFYGQLSACSAINTPIVISIQGLLTEYCQWRHTFGNLSIQEIIRMHSPLRFFRGLGPLWDYRRMRINARRERAIIQSNIYFMGRTDWDRSHIKAMHAAAHYFHVDELLRPEFRKLKWDLNNCRRHSIIFTNARGPRRDVQSLFQAVALLKQRFPDVTLKLAGMDDFTGEYGNYLLKIATIVGIVGNVEFLGHLNAEEMSRALASSHVFVLSSLIENSPNSLCEAQTVGLPCVASYTGGVPSLISEGETGFMVPARDSSMIATRITTLFENDNLAVRMSAKARDTALARHNPDEVTARLMKVYREVIKSYHKTSLE